MKKNLTTFFEDSKQWKKEYAYLRQVLLDTGLEEDFKWSQPCYTYKGHNIVILHGFKNYCALLFHKGVLLKDELGLLIQQTKNVQSARQLRYTTIQEIAAQETIIKNYIYEAIEVEKAGLQVQLKKTTDFDIPEELATVFKANPDFEKAFQQLTPGRQRGYLFHFSEAKQSKTRSSRIEKYTERIFDGKGLNDCVCGLSKRMPNCDGSHKYINS